MNKNKININLGGEYMTLTFVALMVLKLCGVIDWSWWWVTAPIWGPIVIFIGFLVVIGIIALVADSFK